VLQDWTIATRANLEAAGLERLVRVEQADATTMPQPPRGTTLVCNPPYGERIGGVEVAALYAALGRHWRTFEGCTAWLVDGNPEFVPAFGLPFTTAQPMWNGPLAITLRRYELGAV
jgi:putative N6-adenine-specific DNA methylase